MLDELSWGRLIDGLIEATSRGRIDWDVVDRSSKAMQAGLIVRKGAPGYARLFTSHSNGAVYELTSEDPRGLAPYELVVREVRGKQLKQIGRLRSSTEVGDDSIADLNARLSYLFKTVDGSVESSDEVVSRLLRGLGL
jgi:hypothetical protein